MLVVIVKMVKKMMMNCHVWWVKVKETVSDEDNDVYSGTTLLSQSQWLGNLGNVIRVACNLELVDAANKKRIILTKFSLNAHIWNPIVQSVLEHVNRGSLHNWCWQFVPYIYHSLAEETLLKLQSVSVVFQLQNYDLLVSCIATTIVQFENGLY